MTTAGGTLEAYELHMRRRNLRPSTIRRYRDALALWVAEHPDWATCTTGELERWLDRRELGPRSRYLWLSILRGFYRWAVDVGAASSDPTSSAVRPRLPPLSARPISETDAALVVAVTDPGPVRLAVCLMLYAGLRCGEVAGLRWRDVDEVAGRIRVVGKGGRTRWVPVGPRLALELGVRGRPADPVIGARWSPAYCSSRVGRHLRAVGIPATAHQLRHTFATRLWHATPGDLATVSRALGHASVATTQLYVSVSDVAVTAAVELVG